MHLVAPIVLFLHFLLLNGAQLHDARPGERSPKSFLSVVRFVNSLCFDGTLNGTCVTNAECNSAGGSHSVVCALGFGICCIVVRTTCGSSSAFNNTYFDNPTPTFQGSGSCRYRALKKDASITQFRLLFSAFDINGPNMNSVCNTDSFTLVSTDNGSPVPIICGMNPGQHIYVSEGPFSDSVVLQFILMGPPQVGVTRTWRVLVSQIPTNVDYSAPQGCLQYFTQVTGSFSSFNWRPGGAGRHLASQQYSICVRQQLGFCSICLTQCEAPPGGFSISGTNQNGVNNGAQPNNCLLDFLGIPCSISVGNRCRAGRLCGGTLQPFMGAVGNNIPSRVCTAEVPFRFLFVTDATEGPTDTNTAGFCVQYRQLEC